MTFKEQFDALKSKIQSKITSESTPEQIEEINGLVSELDELGKSHEDVVTESAKLKDTIVRMVSTQGDSKQPADGSDGSKPKTIEECVAEELKKGDK